MGDLLTTVRRQLSEFFEKMDAKQRTRLIIIAVLLVSVSVVAAVLLGRVTYTALYTGLDASEAGEVLELLKGMGVTPKTQGSGTILVPEKQADELRMQLAMQGYPKTGLNYDILTNNATGLGVTDAAFRAYAAIQLQENLRSTILKMEKVADCTVIVNMGSEGSYVTSKSDDASVSVLLELKGGQSLSKSEAQGIGALVKTSVPNLLLENITIVDSKSQQYNLSDDGSGSEYAGDQYALKESVQNKMSEQVVSLLTPIFGKSNVRAQVSVTLDFDDTTISKVEFAPPVDGEDQGLMRSIEELWEATRDYTAAAGEPGTATNGLDTPSYVYDGLTEDEYYEMYQRGINYELNETRTEIEKSKGSITRLSIGVLLNANAVPGQEYVNQVVSLVAQALGIGDDYITVESIPFMEEEVQPAVEPSFLVMLLNNKDLLKTIIMAVTFIVIAILLIAFLKALFGVRNAQMQPALAGGLDYVVGEGEDEFTPGGRGPLPEISREKSGTAAQIESFIEKDSAAAAQLLRNWLSDDLR